MYLKISYLLLTLIVLIILFYIGIRAINLSFGKTPQAKRKAILLVGALLLWQLYMFVLDKIGILHSFDLPPRFVVFLILPAFIFTGIFIYKNRNNNWLQNIPKSWLIYFQVFRVGVETLFVYSVADGILHPNVTIEGYNYDMVLGFSAPIVAFLAFQLKVIPEKAVLFWNYLGIAVLVSVIFVFMTTIYAPSIYGSETTMMPLEFTDYPYSVVAGFLMPLAIFIHLLSIVQLTRKSG